MKEKNNENKEISKQVLRRLAKFPKGVSEKITNILSLFSINQNTLAEILDCLLEISKRDAVEASDLLEQLLGKTNGDDVHRVQLLREDLKSLRYPRYQGLLQDFAEKIKKLKLPLGVSVSATPYFEDNDLHIQARLSNREERDRLIEVLKKLDQFF